MRMLSLLGSFSSTTRTVREQWQELGETAIGRSSVSALRRNLMRQEFDTSTSPRHNTSTDPKVEPGQVEVWLQTSICTETSVQPW
jgi:hypothetical protein